MNIFVTQADPIGTVTNLLDEKVIELKSQWDQENAERKANQKWWKFWIKTKEGLTAAVSFLLNCLDQLIIHTDQFSEVSGADKKATVLAAAAIIFDYVIAPALPIWLKPFTSSIRAFLISIILSYMVDFVVGKYHAAIWKGNPNETQTPQTNPGT